MARKNSNKVTVSISGIDAKFQPARIPRVVTYSFEADPEDWPHCTTRLLLRHGYIARVRAEIQRYHTRYFRAHQMLRMQYLAGIREFGDTQEVREKLCRMLPHPDCPFPADREFPTHYLIRLDRARSLDTIFRLYPGWGNDEDVEDADNHVFGSVEE